ncbi:nucleoside diphosphate kinase regulator [Pseudoduganella sp. R-31]|uniref:nucleoside diphosphate kinase regulator n=1 Tax=unclassified Pseudoduganella TaxID=2637179 RepID=UPI003CEFE206
MQPNITISSLDAERIEALAGIGPALLDELARADIRAPEDMPPDVVTMNSTVRFAIDGSGEAHCLTLAYPRDMAQVPDAISILTPIGAALLGLSTGDTIHWPRPDGQLSTVRVLEVLYQPERAGECFR